MSIGLTGQLSLNARQACVALVSWAAADRELVPYVMLSVFMGHGLSTVLHSGQQRTSALPIYGSRPPAAGRAAVHLLLAHMSKCPGGTHMSAKQQEHVYMCACMSVLGQGINKNNPSVCPHLTVSA